ncbi:MAG: c-type cytochrome [Actinobacteria bacterium]|nr:c-type cytochrome [Actinomycetota bacterium]
MLSAAALGGSAAGDPAAGPEVEAGRQVFAANCAMCHGSDASGMMGMHPSLRGAVDRLTVEGVEVTIRNGRDTRPPMPAFDNRLDDQQIDHVIAYIVSLPTGPRNFGPGSTDGGMMDGIGGGMMSGWMWLLPILVVAAIAFGIGALVHSLRSRGRPDAASTPREVLDRRYAQGELTRDEYLQRRDDLDDG